MKIKTALLLTLLVVFVIIYGLLFFGTIRIKKELTTVNLQIEELRNKNQELNAIYLKLNDPTYIEKIAREKLHMIEVKDFYVVEIRTK